MGRQVKGKPASMKVKIKKETPKVNDQIKKLSPAVKKPTAMKLNIKKQAHKVKDQIKKLTPDVILQVILYKIIF